MGELATPSDKERAETRALAAAIVQSVIDDDAIPLGIAPSDLGRGDRPRLVYDKDDVEDLVFRLAYEVVLQAKADKR